MRVRYAAAAALLVSVAACASDDEPAPPDEPDAASPPPAATTGDTEPLDWRPVAGTVDDPVTRNGEWTLTVTADGGSWELSGSDSGTGEGAGPGWRVSDALLDEDWAVVVLQDETEQRPGRATVTDLESGETFRLDGRSDVPTTNGGTWALGDDRLLHATVRDGAYCLADVDLASRESEVAWCAPDRQGFNAAHATDEGDTLLTFDDGRPSCRTVVTVDGGATEPFPGAAECKGWEGVLVDGGAVWSEIPRERQIERAELHARAGDESVDLGPGVAGSLVECAGAAYFVRDPQQQGDPATLMRWTVSDGLTAVYESPAGQAFLEPPRCGGDAITVTARASSGDEQVTADL
ncbi:hypothetical protein [Nocardioides sp. YIM 152315]|uniref:hypothetical protein n=1 Tax=Nocardioides sp. YIM 152315 TaxID=3031760 RepID=UPI0023D9D27D|nr:hypothetical protein [Nocardioides sp. YIM 152315]MDF1603265.1 hypothetical protein [Nocardioides sp. YIM 152315]